MGTSIVLKEIQSDKLAFLDGHSHDISSLDISHDGCRLASGQSNNIGMRADVIIWDLTEAKRQLELGNSMIGDKCLIFRMKQHLTKVQACSFSCHDDYLATIGSPDDNALVIWDVATGEAICGAPAGPDTATTCKWLNRRNDRLVTGGHFHARVWQVDYRSPKLYPIDAKLGTLRRIISSLTIQPDDQFAYFGTTSGDLIKVNIDRDEIRSYKDPNTVIPNMIGSSKVKITGGIDALVCIFNEKSNRFNIVAGGGDGTILYYNPLLEYAVGYKNQLKGGITSIFEHPVSGKNFIVGTSECNRYEISRDLHDAVLISSCHANGITDIVFPQKCADLVITTSKSDVRIWNVKKSQEILRIQVPGVDCLSCIITASGSSIITGWDDGKIRAFLPESGKMKFIIPNAHTEKVTALAVADNDIASKQYRIISGGAEGCVRIWNCTSSHQIMKESLKEHRGAVTAIRVNNDSTQFITSSTDGSCIIWDLVRYVRLSALFETNTFLSAIYHPDESQILTCGTNHKITYWDTVDANPIRMIDGGDGFVNTLDIESANGEFFASGCADQIMKVWLYDEGLPVGIGRGHTSSISVVKFSPDMKFVVSAASSGELIFWELPSINKLRDVIPSELR